MNDYENFLTFGSEYMAKVRPDLWTARQARDQLVVWMDNMRHDKDIGSIGTGGFILYHYPSGDYDSDVEEFSLQLHIVDGYSDADDEDIFDWTTNHAN